MKTKLLSITLAILAFLSSCNDPVDENITESVKFTFPDGWQSITNHEEKIAALQIPENILSKISTENLVEACMTYPLGPECFFYNDYQFGIARVINNFNGFDELKKHSNAFDKVLDYYSMELDSLDEMTDSKDRPSLALYLYYNEQFIISGYLLPADQLKDSPKLINLYYKAEKLRENYEEFQGHSSIYTLSAMKKVLELE